MDALSGDRLAGAEVVIALIYRCSIIPSYWESSSAVKACWSAALWRLRTRDVQPLSVCRPCYHDLLCAAKSYGRWRIGTLANKSVGRGVLSDPHLFPKGPVGVSLIGNYLWKLTIWTQYNTCEGQFITFVLNIPYLGHPYWCVCVFFFFFLLVLKTLKWKLAKTTTTTTKTSD